MYEWCTVYVLKALLYTTHTNKNVLNYTKVYYTTHFHEEMFILVL